jgi:hypothetical protein
MQSGHSGQVKKEPSDGRETRINKALWKRSADLRPRRGRGPKAGSADPHQPERQCSTGYLCVQNRRGWSPKDSGKRDKPSVLAMVSLPIKNVEASMSGGEPRPGVLGKAPLLLLLLLLTRLLASHGFWPGLPAPTPACD